MPRKRLELTKMPGDDRATQRWRKIYKGKTFYFLGDYDTAVAQWHKKQTELETKQEEQQTDYYRRQWEKVRDWYAAHGKADDADRIADQLKSWDDRSLELAWQGMTDGGRAVWAERLKKDEPANTPKTIHQAVESFLARALVRVQSGAYAALYYDSLQRTLNHFADFAGRRVAVASINGHTLESYHTELMRKMEKDWSPDYAASFLRIVKIFVGWCYDTELLESLPRNMRRGNTTLSIDRGHKKKPVFTNEEVKSLLDNASERTQLYLLLMMNCGYTQIDIASLHPEQVDWTAGRITRKRTKTENRESVPEVSYPLWSRTFELLKKFGHRKGDRVLTNEKGGVLKVDLLRGEKPKYHKIDNIASSYARVVKKLTKKKDGKPAPLKSAKPIKAFRKTSPSRLEDSEFNSCARWFGGWSPKSVADKHYIRPPQELFDRAVRWLAKKAAQPHLGNCSKPPRLGQETPPTPSPRHPQGFTAPATAGGRGPFEKERAMPCLPLGEMRVKREGGRCRAVRGCTVGKQREILHEAAPYPEDFTHRTNETHLGS